MRNFLQSAMIIIMALLVFWGTVSFASVTLHLAVPVYALAAVLALLWALKLFTAEAVSWKKSPMHLPVAAFAIYALLRYVASPLEYQSRIELFQIWLCTFLYFVSACNFYHDRDRRWLIVTLMILGVCESLYGLYQFTVKSTTVFGLDRAAAFAHRAGGTFFNPNHLAGFLVMALCMAAGSLALERSSSRRSIQEWVTGKIFLIFGAIVMLLGLLATLSRGGWMAAIIGLSTLLLLGKWKWSRLWPRFLMAGAALAVAAFLAFKIDAVHNRILYAYMATTQGDKAEGINLKVSTLAERIAIWKATVEMIRARPLWGWGGATWEWIYPKYRPPKVVSNPELAHNDALNLMSDYGLVGFGLVGLALVCFFGHAWSITKSERPSEESAFAAGSIMAVTGILGHSMVDFNMHILSNAALFMVLMGFTVAIEVNRAQPERVVMGRLARYSLGTVLLIACIGGGWFVGRSALAYYKSTVGNAYKATLYYDIAVDYYRQSVRLDPQNPDPHARIGDLYRTRAEWMRKPEAAKQRESLAKRAIEHYQTASNLNPLDSDLFLRMGRAYEVLGEKELVVNSYKRFIAMEPGVPLGYLFLGQFYKRNNEPQKALEYFDQARKLNFGYDDETPFLNYDELRSSQRPP